MVKNIAFLETTPFPQSQGFLRLSPWLRGENNRFYGNRGFPQVQIFSVISLNSVVKIIAFTGTAVSSGIPGPPIKPFEGRLRYASPGMTKVKTL